MDELLQDLRDEQADLVARVRGADLRTPTPAQGWDVGDAVAHLRGTDVQATIAASRPADFVVPDDLEAFLQGQLDEGRALGDGLLEDWQARSREMLAAFAALAPGTRVPWYGPPMGPASFVTARIMEVWAHGQDVVDGLGQERPPTARLRHVCHLGWRTRGFSYAVRGRTPPEGPVRLRLTAPDGSPWE